MKYNHFKHKMSAFIAALAMFALSMTATAQLSVSGIVKDGKTGEAILGASVLEKGTNNGVITNFEGVFTMTVASKATLIVRYLGYLPEEVQVSGKTNLVILLKEDAVVLSEVVAIGYGVQKKSDKTGAVMNVTSADFNSGVLTDPIQAMQGKASGVVITKKGGNPNDAFSVQIRGAGGLLTGSSPIYVIDGIPGVDPTTVPAEDIESFNILKDASSTAIYGSRGANGVIIITTKKGSSTGGKRTINVNSYISMDQVAKRLDLLSASDIRSFITRNNLSQVDAGGNTDWQNEIYRNGFTQNHNISIGGGNEKSNYRISGTWSDFQGVVKGTDKQRFTTNANITQKLLNDKLVVDGNLSATFEENQYQDFGGNGPTDVMYQAFQRSPLQPVTNADGTYYENTPYGFQYFNPVAIINNIQNQRSAKRIRTNGSAQYEILPGLKAKLNGAYTRDDSESFYFVPASSPTSATKGKGERKYENHTTKLVEAFINYDKTFGVHTIAALGGYSWQGQTNDGFNAFGTNSQSTYVESNYLAALADVNYGSIGSYKNEWTLISFFARAAYDYDKKYFATATVRRDGSSKFGANKKWGIFPSGSLAWSIKNESFLQDASWLDQLKIRLGYGITGNTEKFDSYMSIPRIRATGMQPSMEDGVTKVITFKKDKEQNDNFQWESTQEFNFGLDWGVLNSKIQGSVELYSKRTVQLIYNYSIPQPPFLADNIYANAGTMTNKGIEANISYRVLTMRNFDFKTSLTFSHNINNLEKLSEGIYEWKDRQQSFINARGMVGQWTQLIEVGTPMGTWYLPHFVDISSDGAFRYATATGGVTRDVALAERRNAGSAVPKVNLGWSNSFTLFKNIDVNFTVRALLGYKVYNVSAMYFSNPTLLPSYNANQQAITWFEKGINGTPVASDYWLEDGSFVRLDNLTVGYNFPNTSKFGINKLRVYFTGGNLLTITGYKGIDPEISNEGMSFGLDNFNIYPKTRNFTLGLQLNF